MPFRSQPDDSLFPTGKSAQSRDASSEKHLVAYVDGGARGNPGPAGYGVALEDESGHSVGGLSEYLGKQTNNYAEYSGLLAALQYALEHGFETLMVVSDSELMVKQIKGQYKVNNPTLKELNAKATRLIEKLEHFEIRHVLREKNRKADQLANDAMDRGMGKRTIDAKPVATGAAVPIAAEVNGVVRDGVVQFMGNPLPDGTLVKVRAAKP